ncbi:MAG: serine/threonine-protein kinase [Gemmatimonadales bacterium]|jgi:serine/threonine-protein kinase|nr:MAG: serine/threonine-protein kinase [Gemmatimonadales bacterium]
MTDIPPRLAAALADRYHIERELGAGGMATVYLADDPKHHRKVALKVLKPELAAVVGAERFLAEIKTTANLQHPHILPLFDSGQDDGLLWYAMPYIQGESLRERLDRERQLPVGEAVAIAVKVAGAIQAAHERGIVHRDIKPANILLMNGEPLVADFGIALAVQEAGGGRLTETGLSMGTPFYMSPEQATADRTPDARADIYSLGCVLYEMLAGEPPFTGSSAQAILGRILTQPPRPITEERGSVPANVASAINRALQKLPADRFSSAAEFVRALQDPHSTHLGFPTQTGSPAAVGSDETRTRLPLWLPWVIAGVASLAAAIFALDGGGTGGTSDEPPTPVRFSLDLRSDPGYYGDRFLRITPDGSSVVYRHRTQDGSAFFRYDLARGESVPIPGTEAAVDPAISPDGRWLAFNDDVSATQRVLRLPIEGGTPTEVIVPPNEPIGISWRGNDELVFGMLAFDGDYRGLSSTPVLSPAIRRITGRGLEDNQETARPAEEAEDHEHDVGMHHEPEVLPGGSHALFIDFGGGTIGIGVAGLETGEWRRLDLGGSTVRGTEAIVGVAGDRLFYLDSSSRLMVVRWDPETYETRGTPVAVPGQAGGILTASIAEDGTLAMVLAGPGSRAVIVDDRGELVRPLWDGTFSVMRPRLSPDGRRIAVGAEDFRGSDDVWVYDTETSDMIPLGVGGRKTPVWSPDGREIFVQQIDWAEEFETTPSRILAASAEGGAQPRELFRLAPPSILRALTDRSSDGVFIAVQDAGENPELARFDVVSFAQGDSLPRPFVNALAREMAGRLSPDQRWLAYTSAESGRPQVYVRSWPGGEHRLLVWPEQAGMPVWDPSGERLYVRTFDGLAAVDLVERGGRLEVTAQTALFTAEIAGRVSSLAATYDVHPEGFVVGLDETDQSGRIVVWKDWIHELDPLLEGG